MAVAPLRLALGFLFSVLIVYQGLNRPTGMEPFTVNCLHLDSYNAYEDNASASLSSTLSSSSSRPQSVNSRENRNKALDDNYQLSFRAENLLQSDQVSCGYYKCYFNLKNTNHNNNSEYSVGYLVTPAVGSRIQLKMGPPERWFELLQGSWNYAEYLRQKYRIKHLLLEPPTNATVTPQLHTILNRNLMGVAKGHGPIEERYKKNSTVFIQKCQTAPEPNLFVASWGNKRQPFFDNIHAFIAEQVPNQQQFATTFFDSIYQARKLLYDEPCLSYDFQALLDVHGNFYYMDFERCLQPTADEQVEYTMKALKRVKRSVKEVMFSLNISVS